MPSSGSWISLSVAQWSQRCISKCTVDFWTAELDIYNDVAICDRNEGLQYFSLIMLIYIIQRNTCSCSHSLCQCGSHCFDTCHWYSHKYLNIIHQNQQNVIFNNRINCYNGMPWVFHVHKNISTSIRWELCRNSKPSYWYTLDADYRQLQNDVHRLGILCWSKLTSKDNFY